MRFPIISLIALGLAAAGYYYTHQPPPPAPPPPQPAPVATVTQITPPSHTDLDPPKDKKHSSVDDLFGNK